MEDTFAEQMVRTALRYYGGLELDSILVHSMGGASPAVSVNIQHNLDPTSRFPSLAVLDGDQRGSVDAAKRIFALPGHGTPEAHVFDVVHDDIEALAARLAVSMQLPTSAQERVKSVVRSRALTNRDRHIIFEQIGEDLDFTAGATVAAAFLALWAQTRPNEVTELIDSFAGDAPRQ